MFANALKKASIFTQPVIISQRFYDGTVESGCGTFIILNKEGWILTAFHIIIPLLNSETHKKEIKEYEKNKNEIESNPSYKKKYKNKLIKKLAFNKKWVSNISYWWGKDRVKINQFKFNPMIDIATGKLEPFNNEIKEYPTFINPKDELPTGTSLCKLGYPFHKISSEFIKETGDFKLTPGSLPMPRFPLDGIYTRNAIIVDKDSNRQAKFIEMSTPGLRGQSGGPIFDINGYLWGMQSRTQHFALGFNPKVKKNKQEVEEHQFLNTGLGTHVEEIVKFLTEHEIKFKLSTET